MPLSISNGFFLKRMLPFFLISIFLLIYQLNGRVINSLDTLPAEYLPLSFIEEFDFDLNEFKFLYEKGLPYSIKKIDGNYYSSYPVGAAIWATPFYFIAKLLGLLKLEYVQIISKISASFAVVFSAMFTFLSVRLLANEKSAYLVTTIYSLATCSWSSSSQALWQHGPAQLFSSIGIYLLLKGEKKPKLLTLAGGFFSLGIWCRPLLAITVIITGIYVFHKYRRFFLSYVFISFVPCFLLVYFNYSTYNSILGGYYTAFISFNSDWFQSVFTNFIGLLISPSRGILIFSPVLIIAFLGIWINLTKFRNVLLLYFSLTILSFFFVYACWASWWGGWSFGPRLLTDTLPFLSIMFVPAIEHFRWTKTKLMFASIIMVWSVFIQVIGSSIYNGGWNKDPNIDFFSERLWFWEDSQTTYYLNSLFPITSIGKAINHEIKGDLNAAKKAYEEELKRNSENTYAIYKLGKFYYQANETEKALSNFQKLISIYPNYIPARLYNAYIYENKKDFQKAINEYKIALDRKKNDVSGMLKVIGWPPFGDKGLGYLYIKTGQYNKLLKLFNTSILSSYYKLFDFSEINYTFNIPHFLYYGWSHKEKWGIWSNNLESVILLHFDKSKAPFKLSVKVRPVLRLEEPQVMTIYLNNHFLYNYVFSNNKVQTIEFEIPENIISEKYQLLRFVFAYTESHYNLGISQDKRKLSAAFYEIKS